MMDLLLQVSFSNVCFAFVLALLAMVVGARANRPRVAHVLWLLVLIKLLTPPVVNLDNVLFTQQFPLWNSAADNIRSFKSQRAEVPTIGPSRSTSVSSNSESQAMAAAELESNSATMMTKATLGQFVFDWRSRWLWSKPIVVAIWLLGSFLVSVWSLIRIFRFHNLLIINSEVASPKLQNEAQQIGRRLGLRKTPLICTSSARMSPMVWWIGGSIRVLIPQTLLDEMKPDQSRLVLAHELAHVRRRDFLVRWLEWLTCVCFWWNPVFWWAQRNLRQAEEICCDGLVLSSLNSSSRDYANSILTAIETIACPVHRPPTMASEINSGGFLQRRIEMVVSHTSNRTQYSVWHMAIQSLALLILPMGIVAATPIPQELPPAPQGSSQDQQESQNAMPHLKAGELEFEAVRIRLKQSVESGEINQAQFDVMISALRSHRSRRRDAHRLTREFVGNKVRLMTMFNRMKDLAIEDNHYRQLEGNGLELLDAKLDSQRRSFQSKIAFNTLLVKNTKLADAIRKQIDVELANDKWTKEIADKWLADIDELNRELKEELGSAIEVNEVKNDLWLANRNLETSRAAVRNALKTWRITQGQFEEGTGVNIQQVAQASEQYHFFIKQATDSYQTLLKAENAAD